MCSHDSLVIIASMRLITTSLVTLSMLAFASSASAAGEPILPLSDIKPPLDCTAKSVLSGTTPTEFPAKIKDIYRDGQNSWLLVEVSGAAEQSGIAAGMSGSPVYCPSASGPAIAGALSYGIGEWGDRVGLATPIEAMLGQEVSPALRKKAPKVVSQAADEAKGRGPIYVSGVSRYGMSFLTKTAKGKKFISASGGQVSGAALGANTILNPGDSLGVFNVTGDLTMGGIGTVSYRDGTKMWAFGHPWYNSGERSTWFSEAPITTIVNNGKSDFYPSYKLGTFGPTVGRLTYDGPYAISGLFGEEPTSFSVSTNVSGPRLRTATTQAQIADESDLGWPGDNPTDMTSALTNIEAVSDAFAGTLPNGMTLDACWSIKVRSIEKPFSFCQKYAGMVWDLGFNTPAALTPIALNNFMITPTIEQASFANLKVENITTSIKAARGGQLAKLQAAKQVGRSRKVSVSYINNAGEMKSFNITLPKLKKKRGKTLSIKAQTSGDQSTLVGNYTPPQMNDQGDVSVPSTGVSQITSEEEMRSLFKSLNGTNKLAGRVSKKRFSVALPKDFVALPVGQVSTRLR